MGIITVKDFSYRYPTSRKDIISDVSFSINKGDLCSIIGPNGAGKTTLCNAIRGFVPHFYQGDIKGDIWIDGENTKDSTIGELSLKVGFVFQNPFTQISGVADTVFEELSFGLENLGIPQDQIRSRVEEIMELTSIEHLRERNPFELSGGQQQRVALASIIVMDPEILVIDEPTSQLDPEGTEEIFEVIKRMKDQGKTIVLVEHKIEMVAEYSDHIILIDDGKIILEGDRETVLTNELVLEHGTALPEYALLGLEMNKRGILTDRIPVTERQAQEEIAKLIHMKGGVC